MSLLTCELFRDASGSVRSGTLTLAEREFAARMVDGVHGVRVGDMFRAFFGTTIGYSVVLGVLRRMSVAVEDSCYEREGVDVHTDWCRSGIGGIVEVCQREETVSSGDEDNQGSSCGIGDSVRGKIALGCGSVAGAGDCGQQFGAHVGNVDRFSDSGVVDGEDSSVVRGKNYVQNKKKREKKKVRKVQKIVNESSVDRSFGGYFSGCDSDVRVELRESRAKMLIAENAARQAKAESQVRHLQMVKESRVNETKFELSRQSSEEKLRKISEIRLGAGFVEGTVCSSAATPSLSSGSVSPNSSMSMAEVKRKDNLILTLERKLAEVTVENKSIRADKDKLASDVSGFVRREKERRDAQRFRDDVAYHYSASQFVQRHVPGEAPKSGVKGGNGYSQWD